jgi:glycosyltransferase involved in cell wall biosynthesis
MAAVYFMKWHHARFGGIFQSHLAESQANAGRTVGNRLRINCADSVRCSAMQMCLVHKFYPYSSRRIPVLILFIRPTHLTKLFCIAAFYKVFYKRFVFDYYDLAPELYDARFGSEGNRFIRQAKVWLEGLSCRLADRIIATNQSYKEIEIKQGSVHKERITGVLNGSDLNRLRFLEPKPSLRMKGKINLVYVGIIQSQDGRVYLNRALKYLIYNLKESDFFSIAKGKVAPLPRLKPSAGNWDMVSMDLSLALWSPPKSLATFVQVTSAKDQNCPPSERSLYNYQDHGVY